MASCLDVDKSGASSGCLTNQAGGIPVGVAARSPKIVNDCRASRSSIPITALPRLRFPARLANHRASADSHQHDHWIQGSSGPPHRQWTRPFLRMSWPMLCISHHASNHQGIVESPYLAWITSRSRPASTVPQPGHCNNAFVAWIEALGIFSEHFFFFSRRHTPPLTRCNYDRRSSAMNFRPPSAAINSLTDSSRSPR